MMAWQPTPLIWMPCVRILPSSLRWCVFRLGLSAFVADVSRFVSPSFSVGPFVKTLTLSANMRTLPSTMHYVLQACSHCRKRATGRVSRSIRRSLGEAATCLSDSARLSLLRALSCAGASCSFWMKVRGVMFSILTMEGTHTCLSSATSAIGQYSIQVDNNEC